MDWKECGKSGRGLIGNSSRTFIWRTWEKSRRHSAHSCRYSNWEQSEHKRVNVCRKL